MSNKNKFKYNIVKESTVESYEEFPKYFLADTLDEAESLYKDYYTLLNNISYTYSSYSNIPQSDLFGEAILGLARASRDYEQGKGSKFKTFAIYKIKTVLNEYVRKNSDVVAAPAYITHSSRHYNLLKSIFNASNSDLIDCCFDEGKDVIDKEVIDELKLKALEAFEKFERAAKRAGISTKELARRVEFMPTEISFDEYMSPEEFLQEESNQSDMSLFIENMRPHLNELENEIIDFVLEGKPYNKIAKKYGKTTPWVRQKLNGIRDVIKKKMGGFDFNL
jgi:RNA polymerase sigma factor (sigma-70 family)